MVRYLESLCPSQLLYHRYEFTQANRCNDITCDPLGSTSSKPEVTLPYLWVKTYVLAIKSSELLAVGDGPAKLSAGQVAAAVPAEGWVGASAGQGAKGRRLYDWTRVDLAPPPAAGMARWLLVRRSRRDGELAFDACYGPAAPPLVGWFGWPEPGGRWRRASSRPRARWAWTTTRSAAGRAGIATLALLAHAFLAVTRTQATSSNGATGDTAA